MIPKSGHRFSEKIMLGQRSMIPKSGHRFSDKIMRLKNARRALRSDVNAPRSMRHAR
jgi:hypothetical protein